MTKNELKEYRKILSEAKALKEQIERMEAKPKELVGDTVKDYSTGEARIVAIYGLGDPKFAEKRAVRYQKLKKLAENAENELEKIEKFINSAEDPEIRAILRYKYIEGLTYEEVAERMHYSERTIIRKEEAFFENLS